MLKNRIDYSNRLNNCQALVQILVPTGPQVKKKSNKKKKKDLDLGLTP